jgi:putative DNA methylase
MTESYKKKLIEVAIPLEAINAASVREKSIRHGHPSTLHLWWARRPLASCRAVLFAQLVDDPSSLPDQFSTSELQDAERKRLFAIIEELVIWENSTNEEVLERARAEIRKSCGDKLPPVYDPFSGGGSIPLEAQRLGLPAYGSDLNPVAVMIGKAMIEIPPKFKDQEPIHPGLKDRGFYRKAEGLAEDVKFYGEWMREQALLRIGHLYRKVDLPREHGGGKATVIAWIWTRTVPSPDPAFSDVWVPLVRSFDLSTKKGKETWVEPVIEGKSYQFEIRSKANGDVRHDIEGTVNRSGGICIMSRAAMPFPYIRGQGRASNMKQRLMAVVVEGSRGRIYLPPSEEQEALAHSANPDCRPEALLPKNPRDFKTPNYGMDTFGDLFTDRQLVALNTFSDLVHEARDQIERDALAVGLSGDPTPLRDGDTAAKAYADALSVYLAFIVDKCSDYWSSICSWHSSGEKMRNTFGRQAIPMVWDYAEANPFCSSSGNWTAMTNWVWKTVANFAPAADGVEIQFDAQSVSYPAGTVISTDPPYYDNIGYADLSDFFFCWAKPALRPVYPELFGVLATPKSEELVATPYRHGGKEAAEKHFLDGMRKAIANMAKQSSDNFPATIYYAFKQSEIKDEGISSTGWATFLQAVVEAGYAVVGTWPMRTEMANRLIASGSNALANSVVLVCRKKEDTAETISRAEFIRVLKRELPPAIAELQAANISPADMPQSAIGPGMGAFSRYKAILESDDSAMSVKSALQLINRELDEFLNDVQGEFDADTRFAITWFEQNGTKTGEYGTANNIATARGISVDSVKHAGIVESSAGKVRILKRDELIDEWDPATDSHLTIWECLQYLVREHEKNGISFDAAMLLRKMDDKAEAIKDLAYCIYDICANKRQDAKEATAYNALIADWTELARQAAQIHDTSGERQSALDL